MAAYSSSCYWPIQTMFDDQASSLLDRAGGNLFVPKATPYFLEKDYFVRRNAKPKMSKENLLEE